MVDVGTTFRRRLLISVDAKGYGSRDDRAQYDLQAALIGILDAAAAEVGLDRTGWDRQTAGDGELSVLPESEAESLVIDDFVAAANVALERHNHDLVDRARLRLRVAVHHGPVTTGAAGFAGQGVVVVSRICDSDELRGVLLAAPTANLVLALTTRVFDETVAQRHTRLRSRDFRSIQIRKKEFVDDVWLYVPGVDVHTLPLMLPESRVEGHRAPQPGGTAPPVAPGGVPEQRIEQNFHAPVEQVTGIHNDWGARGA